MTVGLSGLIVSILGANTFTDFIRIGDAGVRLLSYIASSGILISMLVLVLLVVRETARGVRDWRSRDTVLKPCVCDGDDIKKIAEIASDEFGDQSTSHQQTQRLHNIDDGIFTAIKEPAGVIVGYFCLIRLTQAGFAAVMRNDFHIGTAPIEYINTSKKRRYQNVYVGAVYGHRHHSKMFALGSMINALKELKPKTICARAATKDGLRILRKYGFQPVDERHEDIGELFWRNGSI